MIITPSNELDAVNEILSSVGSSPVNSLEDDLNVDVLNAKRILSAVSTEVQSRGYRFNTLNNIYLTPDSDTGLVPFAHDYIRVFASGYKLVNRSGYFFDLETDTNEFPEGLTVTAEKNNVTVTGIDKELVGSFTASVRANKKPEPYKGKGFRYSDEVIRRKQGKKAA